MNYYALIGLFNGVVVLLTAAGILFKNVRLDFYRSFLVFSLAIGIWSIFYAIWQIQTEHDAALLWMRLAMLGVYPSCFGFLWFVLDICGIGKNRLQKILLIGLPLFFTLFSFSPLMIQDVELRMTFPYWPVPGLLMYLYTFIFTCCIALSFILLIITYFRSVGAHRWQIKWVIFTMAPAWIGGSTNWLLWYNVQFLPLPNFFVGVGWLLLAYAMIRIRLFDVDVLADYIQEARLSTIGLLTTSIHHEIKSPLFVLKGTAENCLERIESGLNNLEAEELLKQLGEKVLNQTQRILEIVRAFRDMVKSPTGKTFKFQPVQVTKALESVAAVIKNEVDSKKIIFKQDVLESLWVYADPYSLEEILLNLILNSCQVLHQGGWIQVNAQKEDQYILITVSDNGPGISQQNLKRIFEPFYSTKEQGTGLGLYIAKQLVERCGGEIEVVSSNNGTKFLVSLNTK